MNYEFAVKWLKAFRSSPEAVCALYADDFLFEDPMLDQHGITDKGDLHRLFAPYANKDRDNGIGVHNFRIRGYIGDERSGPDPLGVGPGGLRRSSSASTWPASRSAPRGTRCTSTTRRARSCASPRGGTRRRSCGRSAPSTPGKIPTGDVAPAVAA